MVAAGRFAQLKQRCIPVYTLYWSINSCCACKYDHRVVVAVVVVVVVVIIVVVVMVSSYSSTIPIYVVGI